MSGGCQEKEWFKEVDFTGPLTCAAVGTFQGQGSKLFSRTLLPTLRAYIQEGIVRWKEEERIVNTMWAVVEASGLENKSVKKVYQHLMRGYDEAHLGAAYGVAEADSVELGRVQDFITAWAK